MASYYKTHDLIVFCMTFLLFQQYFGLIYAHRGFQNIKPPAPVLVLTKPNPPPVYGFRFKKIEYSDAYKPMTSPGPSPGMGHGGPPGKQ
ncbi:hypothetical protein CDL12_07955 [Handroanthus impetiginosus]|uniref:Uncharacterized protein n=1 Tax=Handroanthus impetiginosus TaxID=429701 RepID=A0A2G9HPC8_9LAMI|nr:hypothetical protein CDL12_07955 [Handroanthus impetiginosus]